MRQKRFTLWSLAFTAAALALYLGDRLLLPSGRLDRRTFDRIRVGMKRGRVEAILGGPASEYAPILSVASPLPSDPPQSVVAERGTWINEAGQAAEVDFDTEGKVIRKRLTEPLPLADP